MDEDFDARGLVAIELRRVFRELRPEADLQIVEPISPMALFAAVQAADGRRLAQVAAHATGASVLLGSNGEPCSFDSGTPAERALRVGGAVAAVLALHRVPLHAARPAPEEERRPAAVPEASRLTVRAGDLFAVPWEDEDPEERTYRIAEVVEVDDEGLQVWAYGNSFGAPPEAVDPSGLRRIALHESTGAPAPVPWAEFDSWHAVPVRRR